MGKAAKTYLLQREFYPDNPENYRKLAACYPSAILETLFMPEWLGCSECQQFVKPTEERHCPPHNSLAVAGQNPL